MDTNPGGTGVLQRAGGGTVLHRKTSWRGLERVLVCHVVDLSLTPDIP